MKHKIILQYFKPSGKYYSTGEYESEKENVFEIFDEVKQFERSRRLPGLHEGSHDYTIYVDCSQHPMGYPCIVHPT